MRRRVPKLLPASIQAWETWPRHDRSPPTTLTLSPISELLGKKLPRLLHRIRLRARVRRDTLPRAAGVVEVVGGAGIKRQRNIAALRAAAVDQPLAAARRDLLIGATLEHPHRRVRLEAVV